MPKQIGLIKLKGSLEGYSLYSSKDGFILRRQAGISGKRIRKDPAFSRFRENGREFGRAAKGGKLIRNAFGKLIHLVVRGRVASRLNKVLLEVIHMDREGSRGERQLLDEHLGALNGFAFNASAAFSDLFYAPYEVGTRDNVLHVHIPTFEPGGGLRQVAGATHYRLLAGCASFDFVHGAREGAQKMSQWLALEGLPPAAIDLVFERGYRSGFPSLLVMGIQFGQEVNGEICPLNNEKAHALDVVGVV